MISPELTISIRRAGPADLTALCRLGASTFIEAFGGNYVQEDLDEFLARAHSEFVYRKLLTEKEIAIWLAFVDSDTPSAYVIAGPCKLPLSGLERTAGEVRQLYVRAAVQNHQLGSRLLMTALDWLATQGREPVYVGVWSKNPGALRLYTRFDFEKVGEYDFPVGRMLDREFILRRNRISR